MQVPLMSIPQPKLQYLKSNTDYIHNVIYDIFKNTLRNIPFKLETYIKDDVLHIISDRDIVTFWQEEYYIATGKYNTNSPETCHKYIIAHLLNGLSNTNLSLYIKNNTEDIKEKTPEKIEEEMYNKDVKTILDELNKNIRTINKSLLLIADVLKERGINNENK